MSLVGVVTSGTPWVLVVSYCEHGALSEMLLTRAADGTPFNEGAKLGMCKEIATGMDYLASCHVVHRDLAVSPPPPPPPPTPPPPPPTYTPPPPTPPPLSTGAGRIS